MGLESSIFHALCKKITTGETFTRTEIWKQDRAEIQYQSVCREFGEKGGKIKRLILSVGRDISICRAALNGMLVVLNDH